jgi:hypothetical protein
MRDRWIVAAVVAAIAVTGAVAAAQAGARSDHIRLDPNARGIVSEARLSDGRLAIDVRGLRPHQRVDAAVGRLACSPSGYGREWIGSAVADASGRAHWRAPASVEGAARDGRHVVGLVVAGRTVACGSIPAAHPAAPREEGIWGFSRRFVD